MYSRFTALENHSEKDQGKLEAATAAVIGVGATGSAIAENLARHGVNLIVIDRDFLEEKDVYSSSIYTPEQCERSLPKAKAAEESLGKLTSVDSYSVSFSPGELDKVSSADIILDGTDNLETRQVIDDYARKNDLPWIYTAAIAEKAYSMPFTDKCFNCMVEKPQGVATCETDGVMREVAQMAAARSSWKAVKILTGKGVEEKLEVLPQGRKLSVESPGCEVCQEEGFPHLEEWSEAVQICGEGKFLLEKDFSWERVEDLELERLAENDFLARFLYEGREVTFFRSGRIIVEAEDRGHAGATVAEIMGI